jgi:hypothetical protein
MYLLGSLIERYEPIEVSVSRTVQGPVFLSDAETEHGKND